eukprot:TRINITY_DN7644_c0_g1::TRINITY_DN7644_c0_g1_i1::g.18645::m.18645 TRINITY_DN7644_c0_g1::TRINITY_DN7644_c0_g1_i1::g.18645  ORF type:complete len:349 (+),score=72.38,sp/Q9VTF9/UFD1_DROME/47.15/2e-75,UFD1/PF03152.9/6.2e-79,CDC48_2/PF02933.12/7e+03,CDC48_2/PF02933.12/0.13,Med3/PF11593.3/3.7 TRINITY_DN7644_c0_g1_i1:96-1142(+)
MFGFPGFGGMPFNQGPFEAYYRVFPVSFIDKPQLENGDKIVLPPSALETLSQLRITYPMLFKLTNPQQKRDTHCGVLEFVAEEGTCYIPYWMMQNLVIHEGEIIRVQSATLPKGSFVKFQPQTTDFIDLSNPKAVLEAQLRNYSALTKGDTIVINYNGKRYCIDILESKPADAISIIETDLQVDFAAPLDYKEPPPPTAAKPSPVIQPQQAKVEELPQLDVFTGQGYRLDGRPAPPMTREEMALLAEKRRLAAQAQAAAAAAASPSPSPTPDSAANKSASPAGSDGNGIVFGQRRILPGDRKNSAAAAAAGTPPTSAASKDKKKEDEKPKEEEKKFVPFGGQGHSLKK